MICERGLHVVCADQEKTTDTLGLGWVRSWDGERDL